jgi:large subunit ribosomal protein L4
MQCVIKTLNDENVGSIELDPSVFGLPVRPDIISRAIRWQLSKARSGNHKTKQIGEVSGTTKKPWKQKGTGRARQGSLRSAQFRGGGIIFGPVVRSHEHKLNKKFKKLAVRTALSIKYHEGRLKLIDKLEPQEKTAVTVRTFKNFGEGSALILCNAENHSTLKKSFSNINHLDILPSFAANVYDIIKKETLIISVDALAQLTDHFK